MFESSGTDRFTVSNVTVDLIRQGQGRPLLYLHSGDGVDSSDQFIKELARSFDVIAPSHPGFGSSELPRSYNNIGDLAYFYLDLMQALDLSDCILVGSSFGGWIASEIAIRSTDRIRALVLAAPMGIAEPGRDERTIMDMISVPIAELPSVLFHDKDVGLRAFQNLDFARMTEESVTRFVRNREALTLFGWSPILHNPDLLRWLHRIDVPTLLLWGDHDKVVPSQLANVYEEHLKSTVRKTIGSAGHYMHIEQPQQFADAIREFGSGKNADAKRKTGT